MCLHTFGPPRAFDILYGPRIKKFGDPCYELWYFMITYKINVMFFRVLLEFNVATTHPPLKISEAIASQ